MRVSGKLTRRAYQKLVDEDLVWLRGLPRTLERDHVISIVEASPELEYPYDPEAVRRRCDACGKMTRVTTAGCDHCDMEDK